MCHTIWLLDFMCIFVNWWKLVKKVYFHIYDLSFFLSSRSLEIKQGLGITLLTWATMAISFIKSITIKVLKHWKIGSFDVTNSYSFWHGSWVKYGLVLLRSHGFLYRWLTIAQSLRDQGKTSRDQEFKFSIVRNFPSWPTGFKFSLTRCFDSAIYLSMYSVNLAHVL